MQIVRSIEQDTISPVGWAVRTMLLSKDPSDAMARKLAALGCIVEQNQELFSALDAVLSDPSGYGLFVLDADGFGGLTSGQRAFRLLGDVVLRVPMILVSNECNEHVFPQDKEDPTILRAPLSSIALRVGFEHAMRHRRMVFS